MLLAKESLMDPIDIQALSDRGPRSAVEELRLELYEKVNLLGIGAQGLGGVTTVLDVKVRDYPTHAASLPVAMIPNCAATRHVHFTLDGSGAAVLTQPKLSDWPDIRQQTSESTISANLDTLTREEIGKWKPGQTILLSGKLLTGRDAAHKRIAEYFAEGKPLPNGVDFHNRFIYYVGPVDAVGDEAVGPAGPTTATRMDKFTDMMLEQAGVLGMIGKAERGKDTVAKIKQHQSVYLIAVGGAAYLVSKAIKSAKVLAFEDLGMEAIYEFEVDEMPVTVAVDSRGESVHHTGPEIWKKKLSVAVPTR
jgi:fumarate hydratase class I